MYIIKIFINNKINKQLMKKRERFTKILLYKNISIHERIDRRSRWENPFNVIDMLIGSKFSPRSLIPHENDRRLHEEYPLE